MTRSGTVGEALGELVAAVGQIPQAELDAVHLWLVEAEAIAVSVRGH